MPFRNVLPPRGGYGPRDCAGDASGWPRALVGLYEGTTGEEPSERVKEAAREIERAALERAGDDPPDEEIATAVREEIQQGAE